MNKKKMVLWFLPLIQLVITVVSLIYLPKKIPIHFNFHGEVDRLGERYELLVIVIIPIILSMLLQREIKKIYKHPPKDDGLLKKTNMLYWIGIIANGIFLSISCVLIYLAVSDEYNVIFGRGVNSWQIANMITGGLMIFSGLIMSFCKKNYIVGIKTRWSMSNEEVWRKSQKYSGAIFIIAGVIIFISMLINKDFKLIIWATVIIMITIILCTFISKAVFDKNEKRD